MIRGPRLAGLIVASLLPAVAGGCFGSWGGRDNGTPTTTSAPADSARASDRSRRYPLDSLATTTVTINGHVFRVWLAQEFDPRRPAVVAEGLMHVPPEEIEDDQGMLFVFYDERVRAFWMRNTITPLDVAFARLDGTIVSIRQMPPRTDRSFSSYEPALFALEVKQGTFARLGIEPGARLEIPASALVAQ